jgi:hypothetical protein
MRVRSGRAVSLDDQGPQAQWSPSMHLSRLVLGPPPPPPPPQPAAQLLQQQQQQQYQLAMQLQQHQLQQQQGPHAYEAQHTYQLQHPPQLTPGQHQHHHHPQLAPYAGGGMPLPAYPHSLPPPPLPPAPHHAWDAAMAMALSPGGTVVSEGSSAGGGAVYTHTGAVAAAPVWSPQGGGHARPPLLPVSGQRQHSFPVVPPPLPAWQWLPHPLSPQLSSPAAPGSGRAFSFPGGGAGAGQPHADVWMAPPPGAEAVTDAGGPQWQGGGSAAPAPPWWPPHGEQASAAVHGADALSLGQPDAAHQGAQRAGWPGEAEHVRGGARRQ